MSERPDVPLFGGIKEGDIQHTNSTVPWYSEDYVRKLEKENRSLREEVKSLREKLESYEKELESYKKQVARLQESINSLLGRRVYSSYSGRSSDEGAPHREETEEKQQENTAPGTSAYGNVVKQEEPSPEQPEIPSQLSEAPEKATGEPEKIPGEGGSQEKYEENPEELAKAYLRGLKEWLEGGAPRALGILGLTSAGSLGVAWQHLYEMLTGHPSDTWEDFLNAGGDAPVIKYSSRRPGKFGKIKKKTLSEVEDPENYLPNPEDIEKTAKKIPKKPTKKAELEGKVFLTLYGKILQDHRELLTQLLDKTINLAKTKEEVKELHNLYTKLVEGDYSGFDTRPKIKEKLIFRHLEAAGIKPQEVTVVANKVLELLGPQLQSEEVVEAIYVTTATAFSEYFGHSRGVFDMAERKAKLALVLHHVLTSKIRINGRYLPVIEVIAENVLEKIRGDLGSDEAKVSAREKLIENIYQYLSENRGWYRVVAEAVDAVGGKTIKKHALSNPLKAYIDRVYGVKFDPSTEEEILSGGEDGLAKALTLLRQYALTGSAPRNYRFTIGSLEYDRILEYGREVSRRKPVATVRKDISVGARPDSLRELEKTAVKYALYDSILSALYGKEGEEGKREKRKEKPSEFRPYRTFPGWKVTFAGVLAGLLGLVGYWLTGGDPASAVESAYATVASNPYLAGGGLAGISAGGSVGGAYLAAKRKK